MKSSDIDIITACYNSSQSIANTLQSIKDQKNVRVNHIVIDGLSTDETLKIVQDFNISQTVLSEHDCGIYDALNKGLKHISAPIVGLLHSDDEFYNSNVLEKVKIVFDNNPSIDIVYGNLIYVQKELGQLQRLWREPGSKATCKYGWMPPHPTTFYRKEFLERLGSYNTKYCISADYEYLLRAIIDHEATLYYIDDILVRMRTGGASNKYRNLLKKMSEDYQILTYTLLPTLPTLLMKNIRKIRQFFPGNR
jgi:glycosyltransferase involved in cell wall biosynthesis